jgi:hypothetical protein
LRTTHQSIKISKHRVPFHNRLADIGMRSNVSHHPAIIRGLTDSELDSVATIPSSTKLHGVTHQMIVIFR